MNLGTTNPLQLSDRLNAVQNWASGLDAGKVTVSSATGVTLTAAQVLAPILVRTSGSGGISDALPTAAALVAQVVALTGNPPKVGSTFKMQFRNEGSGTQTLTAGTGITLRAGNTNTIATINSRDFILVFSNVTAGSEAVEVISGPASAY